MTADARDRSAARIRQLARRGLDVASFWRECNQVLATAVPHYLAPCWFTFDPAATRLLELAEALACVVAPPTRTHVKEWVAEADGWSVSDPDLRRFVAKLEAKRREIETERRLAALEVSPMVAFMWRAG